MPGQRYISVSQKQDKRGRAWQLFGDKKEIALAAAREVIKLTDVRVLANPSCLVLHMAWQQVDVAAVVQKQ